MPRLFCAEPVQQNTTFALDARVAQHVRVLRLREGEAIVLFDGTGGEVPATLTQIGKRDVLATTVAHVAVERETPRSVTLYPSLIANDRLDWLVQKATELGVTAIQPTFTERSQRIPGDVEKRAEHWRGVSIAACEQCGRNRIPKIYAPITLSDAFAAIDDQSLILLDADGSADKSPSTITVSSAVLSALKVAFHLLSWMRYESVATTDCVSGRPFCAPKPQRLRRSCGWGRCSKYTLNRQRAMRPRCEPAQR